jgi:hypothetical protein
MPKGKAADSLTLEVRAIRQIRRVLAKHPKSRHMRLIEWALDTNTEDSGQTLIPGANGPYLGPERDSRISGGEVGS